MTKRLENVGNKKYFQFSNFYEDSFIFVPSTRERVTKFGQRRRNEWDELLTTTILQTIKYLVELLGCSQMTSQEIF